MNCCFSNKDITAYADEKGFIFVKDEKKNLFLISFESIQKPISYYKGNLKFDTVLNGVKCNVVVNEIKKEFTTSVFCDTRDKYKQLEGCFISFKKLYPSLVSSLIEELEILNSTANRIFYVVRKYLETKPVPIFESDKNFI